MPLAYTMSEGGEWQLAYPDVPAGWSSMLYEDGWIYDRVLERLGHSPWRRFGQWWSSTEWWLN